MNRSHGHTLNYVPTRTYSIWANMIQRCKNQDIPSYANYGARGISVCDRWVTFEGFLRDMGAAPDGLMLDRINNNGNYEPSNCRWATATQQMENKRTNRLVTAFGETKCLSQWIRDTRCATTYHRLKVRLNRGWDAERAIITKSKDFAGQTSCQRGHPYNQENTYFSKGRAHRACRICARERETRERRKDPWRVRRSMWTHCMRGHEFTLENTYRNQAGHRRCRACRKQREGKASKNV